MTIIKISGDKEPYKPPEPEVGGELPAKDPLAHLDDDVLVGGLPLGIAVRKPGKGRKCAGLATLLLVLSCGIITVGLITGLYLWHQTHGPRGRGGICGAAYQDGDRMGLFQENVHLPNDDTELIDVPHLGRWQRSRIIHSFSVRKTAIEDLDNHRCYVMDLDEKLVKPPTNVWELIVKIRRGDYFPQEEVIRRTMRVDEGPLTLGQLREFGPWIYNACEALPTFTLVNVDEADRILDREPRDGDLEDEGFRKRRSAQDIEMEFSTASYTGSGDERTPILEINVVKVNDNPLPALIRD